MTRPADSHCPYCALQCAMTLTPVPEPVAAVPEPVEGVPEPVEGTAAATPAMPPAAPPVTIAGRDFPTNRGGLCKKGWTSA